MTAPDLEKKIGSLQGPVLVLGASGFLGANLLRALLAHRGDVYGTVFDAPAWRLSSVPAHCIIAVDLLMDEPRSELFERIKPRTVFDCVGYGGYSFESDGARIYETNFHLTAKLLKSLEPLEIACYVHAGSSSEYGDSAAGAREDDLPQPNSTYAVSKLASANLLRHYGKNRAFPCANLRIFSAYGPLEDASRLIPALVICGRARSFPAFVEADVSRDFVYVADVCEAFIDTAIQLSAPFFGDSFNVGSGQKTTVADVAKIAGELFAIPGEPVYGGMPRRAWDLVDWYSNQDKTARAIGWAARTDFRRGLELTADWYDGLLDKLAYRRSSKQYRADRARSVSAVVACYKDAEAIPFMHERLTATFRKLELDYEIIFVNDGSPDDSEEVIRAISGRDGHVLGISHSRNFGSQAAFRSGMEAATKSACVLLDGDLQDPPELIEDFVGEWNQGFDVVYGRRVSRDGSLFMRVASKLFYRIYGAAAQVSIPHDAGDFSLMDRRAVEAILQHPERGFFLRGIRASVGFRQTGVDYRRPARRFGRSSNGFFKNVGWAKKAILSSSYAPLLVLTCLGASLLLVSVLLGLAQVTSRLLHPVPAEDASLMRVCVCFFGSLNLLAIGLLGEYIAKILEETKRRPHFIRNSITRDGRVEPVSKPAFAPKAAADGPGAPHPH